MNGQIVEDIWETAAERVDDDLRVVTRYEGTEFETRMRDDVRETYTAADDQTVVDNTILTHLTVSDTETVFETGEIQALVRVCEDAWILSWANDHDSKSGIIISIERHGEDASMEDVEWCVQYLNDEIATRLDEA